MNFIEVYDFLDKFSCKEIINIALPRLVRSQVAGVPSIHPIRTSWQCLLESNYFRVLEIKLEKITKIDASFHESWRVIRYRPGEYYNLHYDWLSNKISGQRTKSVIIYLNDVGEGGETHFPIIKKSFKPEMGKLLIWDNVDVDGNPLNSTLHEGISPVSEDKWVLTTWYH